MLKRPLTCKMSEAFYIVRTGDKVLKAVPIVGRARDRSVNFAFAAAQIFHIRGAKRTPLLLFPLPLPGSIPGGGIQRRGIAIPLLCVASRGRGGNRRSAAGGGYSEPVSRKRHDWRPHRGRESFCRDGVRNRNPPAFLEGVGEVSFRKRHLPKSFKKWGVHSQEIML